VASTVPLFVSELDELACKLSAPKIAALTLNALVVAYLLVRPPVTTNTNGPVGLRSARWPPATARPASRTGWSPRSPVSLRARSATCTPWEPARALLSPERQRRGRRDPRRDRSDIGIDYGVSIADLRRAIQHNVNSPVERMTGLEVTDVNVAVDDDYLGETAGRHRQGPGAMTGWPWGNPDSATYPHPAGIPNLASHLGSHPAQPENLAAPRGGRHPSHHLTPTDTPPSIGALSCVAPLAP